MLFRSTAAGKPRCRPCASSKKSCHPASSVVDRFPSRPLPARATQPRGSVAPSVSSSTRRAAAAAASASISHRASLPRATVSNSRTRRHAAGDDAPGALDLARRFTGVELPAAGKGEETHDRTLLDATDRVALQVLEESLVRAQLERSLAQEREAVLRQRIANLFAAARKGR